MIEIYYLCTDAVTPEIYNKMREVLPDERIKKAESYLLEGDRLLSMCAGYLLYAALKRHGIEGEEAQFVCGANGKPYLKNNRLYFNISHSKNLAAVAISDGEVGLDVERVEAKHANLANKICTDAERERILALPEEHGRELLIRLWTVKESYVKFAGTGFNHSPKKFETDFSDGVKLACEGIALKAVFTEYNIGSYKLTVCSGTQRCVNQPVELYVI